MEHEFAPRMGKNGGETERQGEPHEIGEDPALDCCNQPPNATSSEQAHAQDTQFGKGLNRVIMGVFPQKPPAIIFCSLGFVVPSFFRPDRRILLLIEREEETIATSTMA